ncbi:MAG: CoA ester lyase, partial [Betaproteobacteria bacterium]|nr:CoA ester lyase [Betaproteobacteria bacterium]
MVPVTDAERVGQAWRHNADAITLDLEDGVAAARKAEARGLIRAAIAPTGQGAAEVFLRVNKPFLQADL